MQDGMDPFSSLNFTMVEWIALSPHSTKAMGSISSQDLHVLPVAACACRIGGDGKCMDGFEFQQVILTMSAFLSVLNCCQLPEDEQVYLTKWPVSIK